MPAIAGLRTGKEVINQPPKKHVRFALEETSSQKMSRVMENVDNCADVWKFIKSTLIVVGACFKELAKFPGYAHALTASGDIYDSFSILGVGRDLVALFKTISTFAFNKTVDLIENIADLICDSAFARALLATLAIWGMAGVELFTCNLVGFGALALSFVIKSCKVLPTALHGKDRLPWMKLAANIGIAVCGVLGVAALVWAAPVTLPMALLGAITATLNISHSYFKSEQRIV